MCGQDDNGRFKEQIQNLRLRFRIKRSLRHGDPLSIINFNIVPEPVGRTSGINTAATVLNKRH